MTKHLVLPIPFVMWLAGCGEAPRERSAASSVRCLQPEMAIDDFAVASNETWDFESELANRFAHAIDSRVVFPGIARILSQTFDWPKARETQARVVSARDRRAGARLDNYH